MVGARAGLPDRPQVGELHFKAFNFKPQCRPTGKDQGNDTARRLAFSKINCQKVEHRLWVGRAHVAAFDRSHAVKSQRRAAAAKFWGSVLDRFPVKPVHADDEPVLGRSPENVADFEDGILKMSGDNRHVVLIESNELERFHGRLRMYHLIGR